MSAIHLTADHLRVYAAWIVHGPGSARQIAEKSGLSVIEVFPRTEDLHKVGGLTAIGVGTEGVLYAVAFHEVNIVGASEAVERRLNTRPMRDQVSIAAGVMAKFARNKKRAAVAEGRSQLELSSQ